MEFSIYFSAEEETIHPLIPSLEYIAVFHVAIDLWNRNHIQALIDEHRSKFVMAGTLKYDWEKKKLMKENWETIELKVMDLAKKLSLPPKLKIKLVGFIKPVGEEISKWNLFHEYRLRESHGYHGHLPMHELHWTAFGRIDRKRTAQALVRDQKLSFDVRYKLACAYCLESDVIELWSKLPDEYKEHRRVENDCVNLWMELVNDDIENNVTKPRWNEMQSLWYRVIEKGGVENMLQHEGDNFFPDFLVQQVWYDNNKPAVEYFFPKLTKESKTEFLKAYVAKHKSNSYSISACHEFEQETYFFMLSLLDAEKLSDLLAKPRKVYIALASCLQYPFQNLFLKLADCLWPFFERDTFHHLLSQIIEKVRNKYEDYDYQELLSKFWHHSPKTKKQNVIDCCDFSCCLLFSLFEIGDKRNIQLIWGCTTTKEKEIIISRHDKVRYRFPEGRERNYSTLKKYQDPWMNLLAFLIKLSRTERRKNSEI